jgi:hypothetical protein
MAFAESRKETTLIGGDRRRSRRFDIQMDLSWKLIRRRRVIDRGVGRSVDLSSSGLMFEANRHLPVGLDVELALAWPVRLQKTAALKLAVRGRIVRSDGNRVAVRMTQRELKTAPVPVGQTPLSDHTSAFAGAFH